MMIRREIGILGAALLFGVSTARVSSTQEQGTGPAVSETARGQGAQAWTNYRSNARNRLQFNFHHQKVGQVGSASGNGSRP